MEIQCPQCQRALTIDDQYAGQLMQCPMCNGQFEAPSLAPTPGPATTPSQPRPPSFDPPDDPYAAGSPPTASGNDLSTVEEQPYQPSQPYQQGPPGDYTKKWTIGLSLKVVPFLPVVLLSLVFLLSFFPWFSVIGRGGSASANLWTVAFSGEGGNAPMMLFTIFAVFLAWPLSIISFLIALNLIPLTGGASTLRAWRSVIVGGLLLAATAFFCITYVQFLFSSRANFRGFDFVVVASVWMKLAFRLVFIALISLLIEFWLEWRRKSNLPAPKIDIHF